jgi:hypothetical protein
MSAQQRLNSKPPGITLLVVTVTELLLGCASTGTFFDTSNYLRPFSTVSVAQHGLSLAVWLEDQCERQVNDDRTVTLLEALHDGLVVPTQTLFAITVVTVAGTAWSLYDRLTLPADEPLPNRPEMIMPYVKAQRAGPIRIGEPQKVAWFGCLSISGDK